MKLDKFKALWISHSKISDFLKCPRLFYLRNVYKDPRTRHKITVMTPSLALGQAVHSVVESLSDLALDERFLIPPMDKLDIAWESIRGKLGGFNSPEEEDSFKKRAADMIKNVIDNPGPILKKAVKPKRDESGLSWYWFNEEENIILSGKIDWLEYLESKDSVHIIDFKTGKNDEDENSLQLPIYLLLARNLQKRPVAKMSYWYLDRDKKPREVRVPNESEAYEKVYEIAKRIKLAYQIDHFKCPKGGCFACRPLERVLSGEGELVGVSNYGQDIYILKEEPKQKPLKPTVPADTPH